MTVIFSCTWLALHPNLPRDGGDWFLLAMRRAWHMVCGLVAPEIIVLWAMRQLIVANRKPKTYEGIRIK